MSPSSDFSSRKLLGNQGEKNVAQYLEQDGFVIIAKNYSKRCGEVDIIAQKRDLISFVEVKTRIKETVPFSDLIRKSKQKKIIATAKMFIAENNLYDKAIRFDVAFVEQKNWKITYIPNAFVQENF
ncbi:YraN family protein [bacterium]|jgi:putative endonuclease|nr:YraN family protein [bacterium]